MLYPDSLPLTEMQTVLKLLMGSEKPEPKALVHDVWVVSGYLLKLVVGDPGSATAQALSELPDVSGIKLSDVEAAAMLQILMSSDETVSANEIKALGLFDGAVVKDLVVKQIAKVLLPLLLEKLSQYVSIDNLKKLFNVQSTGGCGCKPGCCNG